jgi:hypothetical protein
MNEVLYSTDAKFKSVCIRVKDMSNIYFIRVDQRFSLKMFFFYMFEAMSSSHVVSMQSTMYIVHL